MQQEKQKIQNHPLFLDDQFVPSDMKYVLLVGQSKTKQNLPKPISHSIVVPYQYDGVTFHQLQSQLKSKVLPNGIQKLKIKIPQISHKEHIVQDQSPQTIKSYKKKIGKKSQSIQVFPIFSEEQQSPQKKAGKDLYKCISSVEERNVQKFEICLIVMAKNSDVFPVELKWSPNMDVQQILLDKINALYSCDLTKEDIQFRNLNTQLSVGKEYCSFRFKQRPIENTQSFKQLIFQQSQPVYIGVEIINSKFKLIKPKPKNQILSENGLDVPLIGATMLNNPLTNIAKSQLEEQQAQQVRIMLINFQWPAAIRIDYNEVKQYKIKFLLGILNVPNYDRKGLMVLGHIYQPDQYVSAFEHAFKQGSDVNFIAGKITSEKELFLSEIAEAHPFKNQTQLKNLIQVQQVGKNKSICLSAYLNQGMYNPKDNNQRQQLITKKISDYIINYFIQYKQETTIWNRYITTLLRQMESLQTYRGWTFRIVNYCYDRQVGEKVELKNFVVTTKNYNKIEVKLSTAINKENMSTVFKIKSTSGRLGRQIGLFQQDEVLFPPYSSFQIVRKQPFQNRIEYQLQQAAQITSKSRINILIWVDDKQQEGKVLYNQLKKINIIHPIYFYQVASNSQLLKLIENKGTFFDDQNSRKIVVTNMKRTQQGKLQEDAGVQTYRIAQQKLGKECKVIFYIGHIQGTKSKLSQKGVDPSSCLITNNCNTLRQKLVELSNWQDLKKPSKLSNSFVFANSDQDEWGNVFSNITSTVKSSIIK